MTNLALLGLVLNTLGTALVWKFGLPADINRHGHSQLVTFGADEEEKKKGRLYDICSNFGMGFILAGFILQAIAIFSA